MADARKTCEDLSSIIVPDVYGFSTARPTAMQRIVGTKVTDADTLSAAGRRKLGNAIVKTLLGSGDSGRSRHRFPVISPPTSLTSILRSCWHPRH
jgi:hypothetical protein